MSFVIVQRRFSSINSLKLQFNKGKVKNLVLDSPIYDSLNILTATSTMYMYLCT